MSDNTFLENSTAGTAIIAMEVSKVLASILLTSNVTTKEMLVGLLDAVAQRLETRQAREAGEAAEKTKAARVLLAAFTDEIARFELLPPPSFLSH